MDCGSSSGSGTWSRSGPPKKEELVGGKKKGRTWGPSSTLQKERAGGEERYGCTAACLPLCLPNPCPDAISLCPCRLKALGEGSKQWSSSAPNLGKSPKHTPMAPGFASLNEMGKRVWVLRGVEGTREIVAEGTALRPRQTYPEDETAAPGLGVGAHFQKQGFGERDLRVTSSGICRVGILLLEVIGGSPCHQVWGKVRKGGISRVMDLSGCRRVCGGR